MTPTVLLYLQKIGQLPVCEICKFDFQLKGIEEHEVSSGFVLCDPHNPIKTGTVFDAQVST